MAWFEFSPNRRKRIKDGYVNIDSFDGYRYANWDPYSLIQDIRHNGLAAGVEGEHLWVSSEQLQMDSAAAWLTGVRQATGHSLITRNTIDNQIPQDVAIMAEANYKNARLWLERRSTIQFSGPTYQLEAVPQDTTLTWPNPDTEVVSPELFQSAYQLSGELITLYLPTILETLDMSLTFPPEYRGYDQELMKKLENIQQRLQQLHLAWNTRLNPNIPPGRETYLSAVRLIEDITAFGVEALVPVLGNPMYKLKKTPKQRQPDPNAFSPTAIRPPKPPTKTPSTPSFDASSLQGRFENTANQANMPTSKPGTPPSDAFDAQRFASPQPMPEAHEPFDPAEYLRRYLGEHAVTQSRKEAFDPAAHRSSLAEENTAPNDNREAFDSRKYRR